MHAKGKVAVARKAKARKASEDRREWKKTGLPPEIEGKPVVA